MDTIKVKQESEMNVGDEIAHGVIVVARTKKFERTWITICAVEHDAHANYVVWTAVDMQADGWSRESGTYCTSIMEAVADYVSRGGK